MAEITFDPAVPPFLPMLLSRGPERLDGADAEAVCRALIEQHRGASGRWVPPHALAGYVGLAAEKRRDHMLLLAKTTSTPAARFGVYVDTTGAALRVFGAVAASGLAENDVLDPVAREVMSCPGGVRVGFDLIRGGIAFVLVLVGSADGPWTGTGYHRLEADAKLLGEGRRWVTVNPRGGRLARANRVPGPRWQLLDGGFYPCEANYFATAGAAFQASNSNYVTAGDAFDALAARLPLSRELAALGRPPFSGLR